MAATTQNRRKHRHCMSDGPKLPVDVWYRKMIEEARTEAKQHGVTADLVLRMWRAPAECLNMLRSVKH